MTLERERGRERERERGERERGERQTDRQIDIDVRRNIYQLLPKRPPCPGPGIEPAAQTCILTGNETLSLLVCETRLQPTEPPGQG